MLRFIVNCTEILNGLVEIVNGPDKVARYQICIEPPKKCLLGMHYMKDWKHVNEIAEFFTRK